MDVHGAQFDFAFAAPHRIEQLAAAEHPAGMLHEVLEQAELGRPQRDGLAAPGDLVRRGVKGEIANFDDLAGQRRADPAQDRADPGRAVHAGRRAW